VSRNPGIAQAPSGVGISAPTDSASANHRDTVRGSEPSVELRAIRRSKPPSCALRAIEIPTWNRKSRTNRRRFGSRDSRAAVTRSGILNFIWVGKKIDIKIHSDLTALLTARSQKRTGRVIYGSAQYKEKASF
jgi:hypothetical protein